MSRIRPRSPDREPWFSKTCQDVEAFIERHEPARDEQHLLWISLSLHLLADRLYARLGAEADWSALESADLLQLRATLDAPVSAIAFSVLAAFYAHLGRTGGTAAGRATHWAQLCSTIAIDAEGAPRPSLLTMHRRESQRSPGLGTDAEAHRCGFTHIVAVATVQL